MANLLTVARSYRINQVANADPLDLLLMAYDAALAGCALRDLGRTTQAVSLLRNALDFSFEPDIAMGFFRLYQYCAELARKGEYDQAADLLRQLRDSWAQVRDMLAEESQPAPSAREPMRLPATAAILPPAAYAANGGSRLGQQRTAMSSLAVVA